MLVDTFLFFNEIDLVELRLRELAHIVDRFICVEATETFSGKPHALESGKLLPLKNKYPIDFVVVRDMPPGTAWEREAHQRNAILRGLVGLPGDALILVSDADEIPSADAIPADLSPREVAALRQQFFYYSMQQRVMGEWLGTRLCRLEDLRTWQPQGVRHGATQYIDNGGWHFSYCGGTQAIAHKIGAFSHQEYNAPQYTNAGNLDAAQRDNRDLFNRPEMAIVPEYGLDHLPRCVQDDPQRWAAHLPFYEAELA